jgi:serine/threonine protein kinase/tetratricopeptide (TPR) repeat protein
MHRHDSERWHLIDRLIDGALDRAAEEREAWLRAETAGDDALFREVVTLVEAGERDDEFLAADAAERAANLVAQRLTSSKSPGPPASLPSTVGPFRLVREIGHGGMGTVYLAEREAHFKQRVALKLIRAGLHLDEHLVARFIEERQLLANLEHPGIARLLDGGVTDDGLPWFAMEYIEGERIDRACDARRLPVDARLELLCAVCDAVDYAHQRHVVHRDLKPTNILVTESVAVKLLDFGIAKLLARDDTGSDLTRSGFHFLTPDYASPEQLRGDRASPASDVYSLGVLMYELLTARRPSRVAGSTRVGNSGATTDPPSAVVMRPELAPSGGSPPQETPSGIARARGTTPERLAERLRGPLDSIVLKALAVVPERRYATAGALASDIRRHLDGLSVTARPRWKPSWRVGVLAAAATAAFAVGVFARGGERKGMTSSPILAVGFISDHRTSSNASNAGPLADLLATNLARLPSLHVVSAARVYELLGPAGSDLQSAAGAYSGAARRAGASMLVDGSLYAIGGDSLRLDLRRIDLRDGEVLAVHSVTARDFFALVDSGTARLASQLGSATALGSVADVTTHSEAAYGFYQEGVRAHYRGDQPAARGLLEAAVRADSTLAMASYYLWRTDPGAEFALAARDRALRMASHASERERLIIETAWALRTADPSAIASAQRLIARFPQELDGPMFAGQALTLAGDYAGALPMLRRVIVADSTATAAGQTTARCIGCDARVRLIDAYVNLDSLAVAEREALAWTAFEPGRAAAWSYLFHVRSILGKADAAIEASHRAAGIDTRLTGQPMFFARSYLAVDDYERVDRELRELTRSGSPDQVAEAYWYLTLSLRQQGRFREALDAAVARRDAVAANSSPDERESNARHLAQVLYELGRYRESAAVFDSVAATAVGFSASERARNRAWSLTLAANPLASLGDTGRIAARIDTVRLVGSQSLSARDRLAYHHLTGLLMAARGDNEGAVVEFRRALELPTGYTRSNYELARVLLRLGRAREAVAAMQPAVRAWWEGPYLYLTTSERRALLAEAFDSAGVRDSAIVHYRAVARAWERSDPSLAARLTAIRARLRALEATR